MPSFCSLKETISPRRRLNDSDGIAFSFGGAFHKRPDGVLMRNTAIEICARKSALKRYREEERERKREQEKERKREKGDRISSESSLKNSDGNLHLYLNINLETSIITPSILKRVFRDV